MVDFIFGSLLFIIKWIFILSWRFLSGAHMNAAKYNDSTWFRDASRKYIKVRNKYTWWKRKSRIKRAGWRNGIFWPVLFLTWWGFVDPWGELFVIGMLTPGLIFIGARRYKLWFYLPSAGTHSDGTVHQHWTMKPAFAAFLDHFKRDENRRHRKHPGLLPDPEIRELRARKPKLVDVPIEFAQAVRNELADPLDGPPIELKLLLDPEIDMIE